MLILGFIFQMIFGLLPNTGIDDTNSKILFEVVRSKDQNKIYYEVNLDSKGKLNRLTPFKIYWRKGSHREALSYIQRKYAYGLVTDEIDLESIYFHFVSYPERKLKLSRIENEAQYKVFINHQNKWVVLNEIFIQFDGGSFWIPKISNVELSLMEPKTCTVIKENIIPVRK